MDAPTFSTFSAIAEIFVTAGVLYVVLKNYRGHGFAAKAAMGVIIFEFSVNMMYMIFRMREVSAEGSQHAAGGSPYGLFMAATEGVEKALVADIAPAARRGAAFGWFNLTAGAFLLPASVVFGWLYETVSPLAAFSLSAGCAFLAAGLLLRWLGGERPAAGRTPG